MPVLDLDTWLNKFSDVVYSKLGEEPEDIKWLNARPGEPAENWKDIVAKYYPKSSPADALGIVCWERNPKLAQSLRLPKFMM